MRSVRTAANVCVAALTAVSLSGCGTASRLMAHLHLYNPGPPAVKVRPVSTAQLLPPELRPEDRIYEDAKRAVEIRDYGRALDLLQLAKQQAPDDGRVLNALGVVYDKLGRFDLSARYYKLALAAEPKSPIVLANMRYSAKLQTLSEALRNSTPVAAPRAPSPVEGAYADAKRAIASGDYGGALDILQAAKKESPNDERVLNALGVVYDKLGRFDLSARYYQLALASQPNSPVVVANMQYSARLQGGEAAATPLPGVSSGSLLVGRPLLVVNATGRRGADDKVRRKLASAGWTVGGDQPPQPFEKDSVIRFEPQHRRVAEALARTLPFGARLQMCDDGCPGVKLVLGGNARAKGWS